MTYPAAQDKACIDQNDIEKSLKCLPIFLSGCQTLLIVVGPTYCRRLWCVMEARRSVRLHSGVCILTAFHA